MYVCLWSPDWSTDAASAAEEGGGQGAGGQGAGGQGAGGRDAGGRDAGVTGASSDDDGALPSSFDLAPLLAELAPRLRVEREVIWADGRGLDAVALAERLVARLAEADVTARAGVAAAPITAELAARWGPRGEADSDGPTPFLVKERTGWGRRRGSTAS